MNRKAFPLPLCVQELADGTQYHFETQADFLFCHSAAPHSFTFEIGERALRLSRAWIVPQGFRTDFASVPGIFRGVLDSDNLVSPAALIHDWLYSSQLVDRKTADDIFRAALLANGLPAWKARVYWLGVRAGGWTKWGKRPEEASDMLEALAEALDRRGA